MTRLKPNLLLLFSVSVARSKYKDHRCFVSPGFLHACPDSLQSSDDTGSADMPEHPEKLIEDPEKFSVEHCFLLAINILAVCLLAVE